MHFNILVALVVLMNKSYKIKLELHFFGNKLITIKWHTFWIKPGLENISLCVKFVLMVLYSSLTARRYRALLTFNVPYNKVSQNIDLALLAENFSCVIYPAIMLNVLYGSLNG